MSPCNIPIIVLPATSSPADIKKAIDANNQTVAKSDGRRNKCKSRKSFADFNLASLPYKVLFIFGVIVVLLQNNNSSSLEVSRNGRSLGEYYRDDHYDYDPRGRRGSRWQEEEDMYNPRMRGGNPDYYDERSGGYRSGPDDRNTYHNVHPIPAYDDQRDDKDNVIKPDKPAPVKPDGDDTGKGDDSSVTPSPENPDDPNNPPSTTETPGNSDGEHKDDEGNVIRPAGKHVVKPDDENDDKSDNDPIKPNVPSEHHHDGSHDGSDDGSHDGSHPDQPGHHDGLKGTTSQGPYGPDPRGDRSGDEREFRHNQHGRVFDDRRGKGGFDDYNGPDGYGSDYGRRYGDDGREIHYSRSEKSFDDEYHGRGGDDRSFHISKTHRVIDENMPYPPNGPFRGGDNRSIRSEQIAAMNYEEQFHQGPRGGRMGSANPFNVPPRGGRDDDHTFHPATPHRSVDDVNDPRNRGRRDAGDDPRSFNPARGNQRHDDQFFDEGRFGPPGGPGKFPDGRRPPVPGPHGGPGGRGQPGRGGRLEMEDDAFGSRGDFMRRSHDGRGRHGPHGDNEQLPFGCTRAELQEQMTEEELNSKIKNLRPNATVKEMFVLFNQILSFERKKFVKMQEYIMQYSQYLQKTLLLPTPIRMKYWWRAHYNMTDELIKKERGDFQDFYAFVSKGQCQRWDFLYFANAKRKSWDELRDLMKSIWMEILTYKMKKHSKL
ncbi:phist protein (Pf-fam-b) [Plasmodium vivax Brazil I]|uniref:Phist protein (Pf-fam-b) n=1 Tax=Plasmodium vivax (strain Brazil I) TaxID=1033975 RepID=A0A0J9T4K3_PLAV1|nr:phist protein (Pf-fam-b) [Plasmodium vivax Brazil I]